MQYAYQLLTRFSANETTLTFYQLSPLHDTTTADDFDMYEELDILLYSLIEDANKKIQSQHTHTKDTLQYM